VCHKETTYWRRLVLAIPLGAAVLAAQTIPVEWRRLGNASMEIGLASPATGPVLAVWYSADGSRLYARTRPNRVFETIDFENWTAVQGVIEPSVGTADVPPPAGDRMPESGAKLVVSPVQPGRVYALGNQLYRSDDGGRSWSNLTGFRNQSIIGTGQRSVAVSPGDPDQLVVANSFGVWRSMDGGLSWAGLNQYLPNLPAARILATPAGSQGARILTSELGAMELPPASSDAWKPVAGGQEDAEGRALRIASAALGAEVASVASAGQTMYAGAADGRLWVSVDGGRNWTSSPRPGANGPIERLLIDPNEPRVALAAVGGSGPHVLRTTNSGGFWDDLSSNLPDAPAHGVAAEWTSGAVYAATDKGVFFTSADLENASPAAPVWIPIGNRLPAAPATDVKLGANGTQLYAALDGYGVYVAAAPQRTGALRLVNAADFSVRPAAPGSLISVQGGRVSSASVGSLNFPVLAASDSESQIQVPFEASPANVSLALQTGSGRFTLGLPVQAVSPAMFVNHDGSPLILDADSGLMLDGRYTAHSNARIEILATGLGKVQPEWPTGLAAPLENPPVVAATIKAYLDRVPVQVTRATLAPGYIGFYLIEVQLPAIVNAGSAELYITADGQESNRAQVIAEP